MKIPSIPLNTGAALPIFGLGTWQVKDDKELKTSLRTALDAGYRLIDTAHIYKNEHIIGEVLHEYISTGRLKREEIFITSKLPLVAHAPEDVEKCVNGQLGALKLDYIDLYLIHCPCPCKHQEGSWIPLTDDKGKLVFDEKTTHIDTWRELEKLYYAGKLRALGVSRFSARQLEHLYDLADVKPANIQVECHIYWQQENLQRVCRKLGVTLTAFAPLGSPGRKSSRPDGNWPDGDPLLDPLVLQLAEKYQKSPAQILIRVLTQNGISVIPKSVNPLRILENISSFDYELNEEDMHELEDKGKTRIKLFNLDFAIGHPLYPDGEN
ncbi:hypothetical protein GCK72_021496 [Caenorhabditis remanei]|uniref:NADP-dependent oxidoreductase domain-containing protein n=1 Tax=Caenorhabditis remanei TaxID=31234 RepID=A0A6A5GK03_CAERE|nr:hypothetical protein GCK72_021496 [Caenorhabditis remanei]KAF1754931.1 hypothetical protein GCK72_021496 [Caenorhabditis remanei]